MKLEIIEGSIGYKESHKDKVVKSGINLSADRGDIVALLGSNGIGKSTLLRSIVGIQPLLDGVIQYKQRPMSSYSKSEWSRMVSYVSTDSIMVPNMTVYDVVSLGRFPYTGWLGRLRESDTQIVDEAISQVGLKDFCSREISTLSDGEKQRVMIARALAQDTEIVILDEPTAFLDLPNKYEIIYLLKRLARSMGKIILFSTHDFNIATHEVDKLWLVTSDICTEGAPEDLMKSRIIESLFDSQRITFDMKRGDFVSPHEPKFYINFPQWLSDEDFMVIEKALKRIHVGIAPDNAEWSLHFEDNKWIVENSSKNSYNAFDSIYLLCRFFSEQL